MLYNVQHVYNSEIHANFPRVGRVTTVPSDPTLQFFIQVEWYKQERATHKPQWLRCFSPSAVLGELQIDEIVLYDFELTKKGAFKKKTRDYLKNTCG